MAALADLELEWLHDNGATATNRTDAWKQFLNLQGFEYTTFSDARNKWLKSLGYTGTTQDMLNKLWLTCQDFSQPSVSAWIDTGGWNDAEPWID